MGRRLLAEAPDFRNDETFARMRGVLESGQPEVVEVVAASGDGPIGRVRGVFVHRAIPFGADGVLNLVTDVTEHRRMEDELRNYAKVAAHDLREPLMAAGFEYARSGATLATEPVDTQALMAGVAASLANAIDALGGDVDIGRAADRSSRPGPTRPRVSEPRRKRTEIPLRRAAPRGGVGRAPRGDLAVQHRRQRRRRPARSRRRDLLDVQAGTRRRHRRLRHRLGRLPQDCGGARRRDLGRARGCRWHRHAGSPSPPADTREPTTAAHRRQRC